MLNLHILFIYFGIYILKNTIFMLFVHLLINCVILKNIKNINLTQNIQTQSHY